MNKVSYWTYLGSDETLFEARLTSYSPAKEPIMDRGGDNFDPGQSEQVEFDLFDEEGNRNDNFEISKVEQEAIENGLIVAMFTRRY